AAAGPGGLVHEGQSAGASAECVFTAAGAARAAGRAARQAGVLADALAGFGLVQKASQRGGDGIHRHVAHPEERSLGCVFRFSRIPTSVPAPATRTGWATAFPASPC